MELLPLLTSLFSFSSPLISLSGFPAMLSAISSSDGLFGSPFPAFEPWDSQEFLPIFQQFEPDPVQEPVYSNSGSGSDDENQRNTNLRNKEKRKRNNSNSGSGSGSDKERKRRRMVSNRESARRSRMRKQKHLENLRNQVNRLKVGNRDMVNRLHVVIQHSQIVRRENERLEVESVMLQQKLWDMRQLLLVRQLEQQLSWPCNNNHQSTNLINQ